MIEIYGKLEKQKSFGQEKKWSWNDWVGFSVNEPEKGKRSLKWMAR